MTCPRQKKIELKLRIIYQDTIVVESVIVHQRSNTSGFTIEFVVVEHSQHGVNSMASKY